MPRSSLDPHLRPRLDAPTSAAPTPGAPIVTYEQLVFEIEPLAANGLGHQLEVPVEAASEWEVNVHPTGEDVVTFDGENADPEKLEDCQHVLIAEAMTRTPLLSNATLQLYQVRLKEALGWARRNYDPSRSPFLDFARAITRLVWRRFVEQFSLANLRADKDDEDIRRRAAVDEKTLAAYLSRIEVQTAKWLAWRSRRSFGDARQDDLVRDVVEAVLAIVRENRWGWYERPGRPAWWQVRDQVRSDRRRRDRLWLVDSVSGANLHSHIPQPDHALELKQEELKLSTTTVVDALEARLTKTQRKYLTAIRIELQLGSSFRGGRYRLVSRVAERLGRDKAQVSRAIRRIRRVAHELGAADLLTRD